MNYYRIAQEKFKKAVKISSILRYAPGVKMVAVANSLSRNRACLESDIDLFIITRKERIWAARFFCILALRLLNERPPHPGRAKKNKDKICLTFFLREDNLNIGKYKITSEDWYLSSWIRALKPLYSQDSVDKKFFHANRWAFEWSEEHVPFIPNYKRRTRKPFLKPLLEVFGVCEYMCKWIELQIMPASLKEGASAWDTAVIVSDKALKFHTNDRRLEYNSKCKIKMQK